MKKRSLSESNLERAKRPRSDDAIESKDVISNSESVSQDPEKREIKVPFSFLKTVFDLGSNMVEYHDTVYEGHKQKLNSVMFGVQNIISNSDLSSNEMAEMCRVAIENNSTEIIELLVTKGMDILSIDDNGNTFLHFAVQGYSDVVEQLVSIEPRLIEHKNNEGLTPLEVAYRNITDGHTRYSDNEEICQFLIKKGADIKKVESNKHILLEDCIKVSEYTFVKHLISNGVSCKYSLLPEMIGCAVENNDSEMIRLLFNSNYNIRDCIAEFGLNKLLQAVNFSNININQIILVKYVIESLVNHGLDVNGKDMHNNTLLHHYIVNPHVASVLIKYGADMRAINDRGQSPLSILQSPQIQSTKIGPTYLKLASDSALKFDVNYNKFLEKKPFAEDIGDSLRFAMYTKYCKSINVKLPVFVDVNKFFSSIQIVYDDVKDEGGKVINRFLKHIDFNLRDTLKILDIPSEVLKIEMEYRKYSHCYEQLNADLFRSAMSVISFMDTLLKERVFVNDGIMCYAKDFLSSDDYKNIISAFIESGSDSIEDANIVALFGDNLDESNH